MTDLLEEMELKKEFAKQEQSELVITIATRVTQMSEELKELKKIATDTNLRARLDTVERKVGEIDTLKEWIKAKSLQLLGVMVLSGLVATGGLVVSIFNAGLEQRIIEHQNQLQQRQAP